MHRHILLALLLAPTLVFAQLTAGPERPVADPILAVPSLQNAVIATSGTGSIVVFQPFGRQSFYFQRLDANARPLLDRAPAIVTSQPAGAVGRVLASSASDGNGYVVVWTDADSLWTAYIGLTGETANIRLLLASGVQAFSPMQPKIASNGNGYIVIWVPPTSPILLMGRRLDSAGNPVGAPFAVSDPKQYINDFEIASDGHDYLVALLATRSFSSLGYAIDATVIPISGASTPGSGAHVNMFSDQRMGLVWTGSAYLIAWANSSVQVATIDAAGHLGTPQTIGGSATVMSAAGSSGGAMIVVGQAGGPTGVILAPSGERIGVSNAVWLGTHVVAGAAAAGGYLGVNVDAGPANVAMLPPADPPRPLDLHPLGLVPLLQAEPRLSDGVVAWLEANNLRAKRIAGDATLVAGNATSYALASSDTRTAIAWQTTTSSVLVRLLDAPYPPTQLAATHDGGPIDAVVASGYGFVVVWHSGSPSDPHFFFARIDAAGALTAPAAPFALPLTATGIGIQPRGLTLVPTSSGFLALYDEYLAYPVGANQHDDLFALPFDANGSASGPRVPVAATLDAEQLRAAATDGNGHILALYTDFPFLGGPGSLMALPLDERGNPTGDSQRIFDGNAPAQISWNGANFVVVSGYRAAEVSADARVVVLLPAIPTGAQIGDTAVAGNTIAYARTTDEGQRVFLRSLIPGRRRATRQ